jgi:FlaG protein
MDAVDVKIAVGQLPSIKIENGKAIASQNVVSTPEPAAGANSAPVTPKVQAPVDRRSELDVNQSVERVISRVVDDTGSVVDQIPSETELRLLQRSREMAGSFLNKIA